MERVYGTNSCKDAKNPVSKLPIGWCLPFFQIQNIIIFQYTAHQNRANITYHHYARLSQFESLGLNIFWPAILKVEYYIEQATTNIRLCSWASTGFCISKNSVMLNPGKCGTAFSCMCNRGVRKSCSLNMAVTPSNHCLKTHHIPKKALV